MSNKSFPITFELGSLLRTLAKEIYDTPMAFLRENVQNAVDALRVFHISNPDFKDAQVNIIVKENLTKIHDNGIGMSGYELENFFWKIGASGKNTEEAKKAGCIGTFGIGGFANFGVCKVLMVTSKKEGNIGYRTNLSKNSFEETGIPHVACQQNEDAAPHGTIIEAELEKTLNIEELKRYIKTFVRYVPETIFFNGEKISGDKFIDNDSLSKFAPLSDRIEILPIGENNYVSVLYFKDEGGTIVVKIENARVGDNRIDCKGVLRLQQGSIEIFKSGFKLCNTNVSSTTGINGKIDSINMQPTAGRDSLSTESQKFVHLICNGVENRAIEIILNSKDLLAQNTRILTSVVNRGLVERIGHLEVNLADGTKKTLEELRKFTESGGNVYFGSSANKELLDILQAGGNLIVILSPEHNRRTAEQNYLNKFCRATTYETLVEIKEIYKDLSAFEIDFLANLEMAIKCRYEVFNFEIISASITGGVPVYLRSKQNGNLLIYVHTRHKEIEKLKPLEGSVLMYTMATEFCKEYLSNILKSKSPKFFGSGALDFGEFVKRRAELWKLAISDIAIDTKNNGSMSSNIEKAVYGPGSVGIQEVFASTDIEHLEVGNKSGTESSENDKNIEGIDSDRKPNPKLLKIIDNSKKLGIEGYYFRLMDGPAKAFGNDIQAMEESILFWFGNRITYAFTDTRKLSFHYELRLQEIFAIESMETDSEIGNFAKLSRPIQEYYGGIFLPIPEELEEYLVPTPTKEILVRVNYDWFNLSMGKDLG